MWSLLGERCQLRRRILAKPAGRSQPAPTKTRLFRGHSEFPAQRDLVLRETPDGQKQFPEELIRFFRGHSEFPAQRDLVLREPAFVRPAFLETVRAASCTRPASSCKRPPRR